jgi:hypothetical protein
VLGRSIDRRRLVLMFALVMGAAVLLMTALHAIEGIAPRRFGDGHRRTTADPHQTSAGPRARTNNPG